MGNKLEFREKLSGILNQAEIKNKILEMQEVEAYFEQEHLSKEQMELVYDYLLSQKVVVIGYVKTGGRVNVVSVDRVELKALPLTSEEEAYLKEYTEDLKYVKPEYPGEKQELYKAVIKKDSVAKERLIELYLQEVVGIAKSMYHPGIFLGDLIQEGNLGVILGCAAISKEDTAHESIQAMIKQSMQMLIEEQKEEKTKDQKMVDKVNEVNAQIERLSEELGEAVSIGELALYLDMSELEIRNILKLAGEEVEADKEEADD